MDCDINIRVYQNRINFSNNYKYTEVSKIYSCLQCLEMVQFNYCFALINVVYLSAFNYKSLQILNIIATSL